MSEFERAVRSLAEKGQAGVYRPETVALTLYELVEYFPASEKQTTSR